MHFKRKHPRRQVRCSMCTPHRMGNRNKGDRARPTDLGGQRASDVRRAQLDRDERDLMRGLRDPH